MLNLSSLVFCSAPKVAKYLETLSHDPRNVVVEFADFAEKFLTASSGLAQIQCLLHLVKISIDWYVVTLLVWLLVSSNQDYKSFSRDRDVIYKRPHYFLPPFARDKMAWPSKTFGRKIIFLQFQKNYYISEDQPIFGSDWFSDGLCAIHL